MTWEIREGDVLERLREMPAGSVHCCVTSPPYWGLRDYGTGRWEDGDADCEHREGGGRDNTSHESDLGTRNAEGNAFRNSQRYVAQGQAFKGQCGHCGARRVDNQIGLEDTLQAWVAKMVEVFAEVRRVLRDDGTLWLNLGDSYSGGGRGGDSGMSGLVGTTTSQDESKGLRRASEIPSKNLLGQPWRVAFALQDDGWILRSDIIWHKPNPMPESVTDRPTKSHEHVFLLSKSPRYFYDADAVREKLATPLHSPRNKPRATGGGQDFGDGREAATWGNPAGRNLRDVWTINPQAFPEAHFATFPEALPERCIKAGTSARGCCPDCGAPRVRVVEATGGTIGADWGGDADRDTRLIEGASRGSTARAMKMQDGTYRRETVGWSPSCECGIPMEIAPGDPIAVGRAIEPYASVPCTVLDPFAGSGTTLLVAERLGRDSVGIELNPEYAAMARDRINRADPMAAQPVGTNGNTQRSLFQ